MFKKTLLVTTVLLMFAGSVAMQTTTKAVEPRKVTVGSYKFTVEERNGKCQLLYEGPHKGEITLDIPPPCEFARDHTGKAQHFQYKRKRKVFKVILVIGGPVIRERTDKLMPNGCGTQMQAVSLNSRGVVAGEPGSITSACPSEGVDEKLFNLLSKPI